MTQTLSAPEVSRPTRRHAVRKFHYQALVNIIGIVTISGIYSTSLFRGLGASAFIIGVSGAIMAGAGIAQMFGDSLLQRGWSRQHAHNVMYLIRTGCFGVGGCLLMTHPWWPTTMQAVFPVIGLIVIAVVMGTLHLGHPLWFSWSTDVIEPHEEGMYFGTLQATTQALTALMAVSFALIVGTRAEVDPQVFGLLWVFAGGLQFMGWRWNREIYEPPLPRTEKVKSSLWSRFREVRHHRNFNRLMWINAAILFGEVAMGTFFPVYYRDALGASWQFIAMIAAFWPLCFAVASPLWGIIIDRTDSPKTCLVVALVFLCSMIGNLFIVPNTIHIGPWSFPEYYLVYIIAPLHAVGMSGVTICMTRLQSALAPRANRAQLVGCFNACSFTMGALGGLVMGVLMDVPGFTDFSYTWMPGHDLTYWQLGAIAKTLMTVGLIGAMMGVRVSSSSAKEIFSSMFTGGLFNTVYSLWIFNREESEWRVMERLRHTVSPHSRLLLPDLINRLHDPSTTVRIEAIYALGRMGRHEAVKPLLALLNDKHSWVTFDVIWALGAIGHPDAVDDLIRCVETGNADQASRAAWALGQIRSGRATFALLNALEQPVTEREFIAIAEALEKLDHDVATPRLWRAYTKTDNPNMRKELALLIANQADQRDRLYRLIQTWTKDEASVFERLQKDKRLSTFLSGLTALEPLRLVERSLAFHNSRHRPYTQALMSSREPDLLDGLLALVLTLDVFEAPKSV